MRRLYDHVDLRVSSLQEVTFFYETLLPVLGFGRRVEVEGWLQFEGSDHGVTAFFGITESPSHVPNENRLAFWAPSVEDVDQIAEVAMQAGALNLEGPMAYAPGYYAAFFEDPSGNRFEVCHRVQM
ncbi:VOC family protein [Prosthecobacter sp. SYSU 5D2]|uniref:VOC family protein n=1 Tax=Prosthecobacter sp. SYSU 5D2 TaxID=3134134 RepID=UPI0031FE95BD